MFTTIVLDYYLLILANKLAEAAGLKCVEAKVGI